MSTQSELGRHHIRVTVVLNLPTSRNPGKTIGITFFKLHLDSFLRWVNGVGSTDTMVFNENSSPPDIEPIRRRIPGQAQRAPASVSLWREFLSPRNMVLLTIAVIFLLVAIILETNSEGPIWYRDIHVLATFVRESGFAAVIVLIVGLVIEQTSRQKQAESFQIILDEVGRDVLSEIFGLKYPRQIVRKTVATVFSSNIVRTNLRIDYWLQKSGGTGIMLSATVFLHPLEHCG